MAKTVFLLVNLGTPDAPTTEAVRRYLREFLSDRRVIETSPWLWQPLLNLFILPSRPKKSAKAYKKVWLPEGSPLMVLSKQQQAALQQRLDNSEIKVELAMRYGNPSIESVLLKNKQAEKIIVLPLYPQYSATTTASIFDKISQILRQWRVIPELHFIQQYATHPLYIKALGEQIKSFWQQQGRPEKLLLSFHGIPKKYCEAGDPYPQQAQETADLLRQYLNVDKDLIAVSFQSRMGKLEWLKPYTDETLQQWAQQGIKNIQVICPGFAVDCLETLEEIAMENRDLFLTSGGEKFNYIPALNSNKDHIDLLLSLFNNKMK